MTIHRRYDSKTVAIYTVIKMASHIRLAVVSNPLRIICPSLKEWEIEQHVSEGFDIGILIAEVSGKDSWEEVSLEGLPDVDELAYELVEKYELDGMHDMGLRIG